MFDLNMWMSSPAPDGDPASKRPNSIATTANVTTITPAVVTAFGPSGPSFFPSPRRALASSQLSSALVVVKQSPKTPTFARLDDDISDFDERITKLGKRNRPVSPSSKITQDGRPTRRSKVVARKGSDNLAQAVQEKKAETAKVKPRKRR
ncbi:hypothetical protein BDP27DRAFT_1316679 [Rhodocollybia butyracea]|uniref:Uncharacterized protein n=1 Tax=Rhodocollybia butyracea TaxID=206335 RepID=A0A9P5Q4V2_9AGAR|nr:hypothetical protein BDP27DRAFT_1316679 [Rhodocollybia butyracea]